jgi:TonB family protein
MIKSKLICNVVMGIVAGLWSLTSCSRIEEVSTVEAVTRSCIYCDQVEEMPQFPGGTKKLKEYIEANTCYPEGAEDSCVQGRVIVTFIVEEDGSLTETRVVRGLDPLFDAEAVRVVESMPKWIPGKLNGKTVRIRYTIPVRFQLKGTDSTGNDSNGQQG